MATVSRCQHVSVVNSEHLPLSLSAATFLAAYIWFFCIAFSATMVNFPNIFAFYSILFKMLHERSRGMRNIGGKTQKPLTHLHAMARLICHGAGGQETKPDSPRGRDIRRHLEIRDRRSCQKYRAVLTACLVLEMSSIWTCRSSISTSMDLRALTAAAQVNSDSSSCTAIQHTHKENALK